MKKKKLCVLHYVANNTYLNYSEHMGFLNGRNVSFFTKWCNNVLSWINWMVCEAVRKVWKFYVELSQEHQKFIEWNIIRNFVDSQDEMSQLNI
jgi:hypothetical protein